MKTYVTRAIRPFDKIIWITKEFNFSDPKIKMKEEMYNVLIYGMYIFTKGINAKEARKTALKLIDEQLTINKQIDEYT